MATATGPRVGTAWVQITPSFAGFASGIESGMTRGLTRAAQRAGDQAGDAGGRAYRQSFSEQASRLGSDLAPIGAAAGVATGGALAVGIADAMDITGASTRLTAQLDLTASEAERAGDIAGEVFSAGFGGSAGEATEAIGAVSSSIGDLASFTDAQLRDMSTQALGLADTFGVDVAGSTRAVGQMIRTGMVADAEAGFDLITGTLQRVPAALRDDLIPTIEEYSTQFRNMGLDGEHAMSLMIQGVNAGARDIDVVADTIKEFSIEAVAGSEKVAEGFEMVGLDAEKMTALIGKGGDSAAEALAMTLDALRAIEDPIERNEAAIELFGTKAEDMGDALYALDPTVNVLEDVGGAAASMVDSLEDDPARKFSAATRTLRTELASALVPALTKASEWVSQNSASLRQWVIVGGAAAAMIVGLAAAAKVAQGVMVAVRVALIAWTAAQWLLNTALLANPITWIVLGIAALVAAIVLIATKTTWFQDAWEFAMNAVGAAWEWTLNLLKTGFRTLTNIFLNFTGPGLIIKHFDKIRSGIGSAITWIRTTVGSGISWIAKRFDSLSKFPGKVTGWMKGIGGRIVGPFKEGFRSGINFIIDGWNSLSFTLPRVEIPYVGTFGGQTISTPKIPRLAQGAVVQASRGGSLAVIGEGGEDEIVASARRMRELLRDAIPPIQAVVPAGAAMAPAPVVQITPDGTAASRLIVQLLQQAIRNDLGGDERRLGTRRRVP